MSAGENSANAVRKGDEFNIAKTDAELKANIEGLTGTPDVKQYPSGASNLTYELVYPGRKLVLRRPPMGTKPKSGHDMWREYRIMRDLKPVFAAVPPVLHYTDDVSILGAEFYVMDKVEGPLIHNDIPADWNWDASDGAQLCEAFFTKLVELHQVDFKAAGLSDFGKPEGYIERQILGWNRRYEKAWTPDVDKFEDVRKWLDDNRPKTENGHAIVHGDFRIDNCILNADDPHEISAILDWEISALGDPLMDLGNTLTYWIEADDPDYMQMMVRQPSRAPGMMTRTDVAQFYADRTGYDISNIPYYYVYGVFRLGVIIQQIYYRYYHGQNDNPRFKSYGQMTNMLGRLARERIASGTL